MDMNDASMDFSGWSSKKKKKKKMVVDDVDADMQGLQVHRTDSELLLVTKYFVFRRHL